MCSDLFSFVRQGQPVDSDKRASSATGGPRSTVSRPLRRGVSVVLSGGCMTNSALKTNVNWAAVLWPKVGARSATAVDRGPQPAGWTNQPCGRLPYRQKRTGNSLKPALCFACRASNEVPTLSKGLSVPTTRIWRPIQQKKGSRPYGQCGLKADRSRSHKGTLTECTTRKFQGAMSRRIRPRPKTGLGELQVIGLQTATADASNCG